VTVLTVAAVPTTLVIASHDDHQTIAVIQPADEHSKVRLVGAIKKAGDDVIAKLNSTEASCNTQLTQTVSASNVAAKVQPELATAKSRVHSSVSQIVVAIRADQERFARLKFVTPQDEDNELEHLKLIEIIALGDGHSAGTISVTCQTVLITITQTIQITIVQTTPAPCPPREERDDD